MRGAVMILMALDHVRDFIHRGAMVASPTDLATTTPTLFLTRWITHVCAPTFMFTAGLGAFLWWQRGRTRRQLSTFLVTRGLWLIVLELTVMRLAYNFTLSPRYPVLLLVLWALGASMVGLAALVWLPQRALLGVSVGLIALHNLLDSVDASQFVIVGYPLVPWIAVMALGFCFGPLFLLPREVRRRRLLTVGALATLGFVAFRILNGYGDPAPWTMQHTGIYTALSFLDTTKYAPSLIFLLMTLGPMLMALAWLDRPSLRPSNPLVVFGRVPLFYFVLHFYAAHAVAAALALLAYGRGALAFVFHPVPSMGGPRELFPAEFGYDLEVVNVVWVGLVLALYPSCRWFAGIKARRSDPWLSYL